MSDQKIRMAAAIFRSFRGVFGSGRPRAPCAIASARRLLRLLSGGDFDGRARLVRSGEVAAKHQSVEGRILHAMTHVIARDSE